MASLRLQPPDPFNFRNSDEWPEQFRSASGLESEGEQRQVSTLLYCFGEEADDVRVLTSTNISEEEVEVLGGGAPTLLLASEFLFVETRLV